MIFFANNVATSAVKCVLTDRQIYTVYQKKTDDIIHS